MILAAGRPSPLGQFFSHASSSLELEKFWTGIPFHASRRVASSFVSAPRVPPAVSSIASNAATRATSRSCSIPRLARQDSLLHRRQPGLQATHEDLGIWYRVPNQVEFRPILDRFRDKQPRHTGDTIVGPEGREISIGQVVPCVVRQVTNPKRVQIDRCVRDTGGGEKIRGFRHHRRLAGAH